MIDVEIQPDKPLWEQLSPEERFHAIKDLAEGHHMSAGQIAKWLATTRNAIIGTIHRSKGTPNEIKLFRPANGFGGPPPKKAKQTPNRHVRINRPSAEQLAALRTGPEWQPLPGTTPVSLMDRAPRGCCWPVTVEGAARTMFCNVHVPRDPDSKLCYCDHHLQLYKGQTNDHSDPE